MKKTVTLVLLMFVSLSFCNSQDFWQEVILPDSISPIMVSFNVGSDLYLNSNLGLYKSSDDGTTWNFLLNYSGMPSILTKEQHEIFIGIDSSGKLFHSQDDGMTWDTIYTGIEGWWLKLIQDSILFSRTWGAIYKSVDYGNSWIKVLSTVNSEIFEDIIEKNDTILTGSTSFLDPTGGGVYQSLDLGASFEQISLPGHGVSSFALDQDSNFLCGVRFQYYSEAYGVFRSVDNGYTWNNILPGYLVTSLAVDVNGGIYAGCDSDFGPEGVQFSSDNGLTWSALNSGLHEDASIVSLAISPNVYIYAVTVFPTKLYRSIDPVVQIKEELPMEESLSIYPNPAHDILYIKFNEKINAIADWQVWIVNTQGITVYNEKRHPDIAGKVICSTQDLNSGFYIIILTKDKEIYSTSFVIY